mmetsp:Transcript_11160/g.36848  ORF Transcript_11160/g.36848 Transcript_11160/m.36848 type:complete len:560 (-) Transcript_11160:365-2044(-)
MPKNPSSNGAMDVTSPKRARTQGGASARGKKVLISDPIEQVCVDILQKAGVVVDCKSKVPPAELKKIIGEYDGLIVRSGTTVTAEIIESAHKMTAIGRAGTGVDNIDCVAATKKGIIVMNTPGGNTVSAAEHTCALIASLARNVAQGDASMKARKWDRKKYMGVELSGKTLGVLGLGRVGREVISRMQSYGMDVIGYDPFFPPDASRKLNSEPVSAADCMARADFLTVHVPLLDDTKDMINKTSIATMKPGVRIINCARGGIINEADLLAALQSGHVAGAAVDVFESEPPAEHEWALIEHPKLVATPHLGASTLEAQGKVAEEIANSLVAAFAEQPVVGVVNAPNLTLSQKPELKPWTALATSLGKLLAQVNKAAVTSLQVQVSGKVEKAGELCAAAALVGLFDQSGARDETGAAINLISAPAFAAEREMKVTTQEVEGGVFSSLLKLTVTTPKGSHVIAGTVFGSSQRVVEFEGHKLEFEPKGYMLVYKSIDKPGVLSRVSGLLGENKINIQACVVSHGDAQGAVVNVMAIDRKVEAAVLSKAAELADVSQVHCLHIG